MVGLAAQCADIRKGITFLLSGRHREDRLRRPPERIVMSEQKDQLEPEMVELSDDEVGEVSGGDITSGPMIIQL